MDVYFVILIVFALGCGLAITRGYCMKKWKAKMREDIVKYDNTELKMLYEFHKSLQSLSYFRVEPTWLCVFVLLEDEMHRHMLIK